MKILFVSQNYPPYIGGIETQVQLFAHELVRRGHDVTVAAMRFAPSRLKRLGLLSNDLLAPWHPNFYDGPVRVVSLAPRWTDRLMLSPSAARLIPKLRRYYYDGLNRISYAFYRRVMVPHLSQLAKGVDVVHMFGGGMLGWASESAAHAHGVPIATTPYVHPGQWGDDLPNVEYYRRCDAVLGLLPSDRDILRGLGVPTTKSEHMMGVVPIVPATQNASGFRARNGLGEDPVVLYVGRMMREKGAAVLIEAAPKVWEQTPNARFIFIGPPTNDSPAWFAGADSRIKYLGKVSDQEKADALAACDIFAMPSTSEILPAVYLEAWSLRKPVIGGLAHGLPELIEGSGGGIVSSHDPNELAQKIEGLLSDSDRRRRMGEVGARMVEEQFSTAAVVSGLEKLYYGLSTK